MGPTSPAIIDTCYNLAQLCMEAGDLRTALTLISRVHDVAVSAFGPDHPLVSFKDLLEREGYSTSTHFRWLMPVTSAISYDEWSNRASDPLMLRI